MKVTLCGLSQYYGGGEGRILSPPFPKTFPLKIAMCYAENSGVTARLILD